VPPIDGFEERSTAAPYRVGIRCEPSYRGHVPTESILSVRHEVRDAGTVVVRLAGELDMSVTHEFRAEAARSLEGEPHVVVLDLNGMTFLDSSGIHEILEFRRSAELRGVRVTCEVDDGIVEKVLALTGTLELLRSPDRRVDPEPGGAASPS
jgi:anti-sigma B factor antagonist